MQMAQCSFIEVFKRSLTKRQAAKGWPPGSGSEFPDQPAWIEDDQNQPEEDEQGGENGPMDRSLVVRSEEYGGDVVAGEGPEEDFVQGDEQSEPEEAPTMEEKPGFHWAAARAQPDENQEALFQEENRFGERRPMEDFFLCAERSGNVRFPGRQGGQSCPSFLPMALR